MIGAAEAFDGTEAGLVDRLSLGDGGLEKGPFGPAVMFSLVDGALQLEGYFFSRVEVGHVVVWEVAKTAGGDK